MLAAPENNFNAIPQNTETILLINLTRVLSVGTNYEENVVSVDFGMVVGVLRLFDPPSKCILFCCSVGLVVNKPVYSA